MIHDLRFNKKRLLLVTCYPLQSGFMMTELIIVISILAILSGIFVSSFYIQKKKTDIDSATQEIASIIRSAQIKTLASENYSSYGIYFDTASSPNRYIVFKGASYASRDILYDNVFTLEGSFEFSLVSLGGSNETVFDRLTGASSHPGSVSVRLKNDNSYERTIYISESGSVGFEPPVALSDANRVKDSRHVHFDYDRTISFDASANPCTGETINLYFDGAGYPQQAISICGNVSNGKFSWSGTVTIGGQDQIITIKTHHLNSASYPNKNQFSITRDRRYNTKSMRVTISGDASGNLIDYSANGSTTSYSSTYVSNIVWQ